MAQERPKQLVKYLSVASGLQLLESQTLQWSSPNAFISPFEINGRMTLSFSINELLDSTVKNATAMIFAESRPHGETPLITAINRWRDEQRFDTPDEALNVLRDLLGKMVAQKEEQLHSVITKWQTFVESVRICCFCESIDNLTAWERYADNHQGIAISLIPDSDNGLEQVQPVNYSNERPQLTTLKEQVGQILYNSASPITQRFAKHLLSKGSYLEKEREWRALTPKNGSFQATDNPAISLRKLTPGSIRAVYLGAACDENTVNAVNEKLQALSPRPKLFKMALSKSQYKLEPEQIA